MNASITRSNLLALTLTILCTTGSAFAQQTRSSAPAKRPTATASTQTTSARPATPSQRNAVTPTATPASKPADKAVTAAPAPTPAKAAETPAPAPEKPRPGVQTATTRTAPARAASAPKGLGSTRQKYLNAGIGLAAYYGGGLPLGASFEVDIKDNISVGGSVDFFRYGYNSGGYRWNYTFVYAGARGSYHLGEVLNIGDSKFDPYVGATLGFRYAGYNDNYNYGYDYVSPYNSGLFLGAHLGSRYMFSPKVGAFAEVGYGVSALRLGITAKL